MKLSELFSSLDPDVICSDRKQLGELAKAGFPTTQSILANIRVQDQDQLRICLNWASRHKIGVYPYSGGKNWGYGTKVPANDGCILLSMEAFDQIEAYDDERGIVKLGAGVSFGQLGSFLRNKGGKFRLPGPGSTPEASVLGNSLEKGISPFQNGCRHERILNLEIMLANGEVVQIGDQSFGAHAVPVPGPDAKTLFFQSNLGIALTCIIKLEKVPDYEVQLSFQLPEEKDLGDLLNQMRSFKQQGLLHAMQSLHNAYKLFSFFGRKPDFASHNERLPLAVMKGFSNELGGYWMGEARIRASSNQLLLAKQTYIQEQLEGLANLEFHPMSEEREPTYGKAQAYWAKTPETFISGDPIRDDCGLIWFSPALPFRGKEIVSMVSISHKIILDHKLEPMISIQLLSDHYVYLVISLVYDRQQNGADEVAVSCYEQLSQRFKEGGYYAYRLGLQGMKQMQNQETATRRFWLKLKRELDPYNIISPGRYLYP